jgi:hypothetical protein
MPGQILYEDIVFNQLEEKERKMIHKKSVCCSGVGLFDFATDGRN